MQLINGETMHARHPVTFEIPERAERENLKPGDLVKIGLTEGRDGERLWVQVTDARRGGRYVGAVDNVLDCFDLPVGYRIEFGPEHVIGIWRDEPPPAA